MSKSKVAPISDAEREMWRKQNVADLLYWADFSFTQRIKMVEGLEQVARSIHGSKLPSSLDEHDEQGRLKES